MSLHWYNSYYDNSGRQAEGLRGDTARMMLTGQVFSILSGAADDERVREIIRAADWYLFQPQRGGYCLNTDFGEVKLDMGRMFGFAYGHKENGAVFSHMAVMYAYALYVRGFAAEGWRVLRQLFLQSDDFPNSRLLPGIPEYFDDRGRGMYPYLTGAGSWLLLTMQTQVFGVRGRDGDLLLEPKLTAELCAAPQQTENRFPCCFLPKTAVLRPGEALRVYSLYGQAEDKARVAALAGRVTGGDWFEEKRRQAVQLVEELCAPVSCRTADLVFDAYCRQTYLDNALRGGVPVFFEDGGKSVPFYLYSRKHGDPEREYNAFSLGGEYFAQGNGNFRDVNQNRRCGVRFAPRLGEEDIHTFFDLIQTDGYNPLVLTASTYTLPPEALPGVLARVPEAHQAGAKELLAKPFTPGSLAMAAEDWGMAQADALALTAAALCGADHEPNADFKEGYWCDHWTYNLDLIESYLAIYPEREEGLLFNRHRCRWYASRAVVKPRAKRYHRTEHGLRQYGALDEERKAEIVQKWTTAEGGQAVSTLMEKLLLLCAVKTATLDAAGMGIEMEGGKPGWYDALNGLPGLLGSSMAESCELARLLAFTRRALERREGQVELYEEIAALVERVSEILSDEEDTFLRWDRLNAVKESYRTEADFGFSGARRSVSRTALTEMLGQMEAAVRSGIRAAVALGGGICPTYFTFTADGIKDTPDGPMPTGLTPHMLPLFLEGPVHWLKLDAPRTEKAALARRVRESALYDRELNMYKVNESLAGAGLEAGRLPRRHSGHLPRPRL